MMGGGFLGQMHETMKKNRDLVRDSLGKTKRKAFDNGEYATLDGKKVLDTGKTLTETERQELISQIQADQRRETKRKILILVITVSILVGIYFGLGLIFSE
jgi:hypothetical protein